MKRALLLKNACAVTVLLSCGNIGFAQLSGTVNVGAGQTYTSLTGTGGLFEAINTQTMSGDVTAVIVSDLTETGATPLNDFTSGGTNNYHLNIVPDGSTVRSITNSGNVAALTRFVAVSNLKIDGSISGSGRYLRFSNAYVNSSAYAMQFVGTGSRGCSNDTVKNCIIEGANSNSSQAATGAVIAFTATGANYGASNIAILNNLISSPGTYNSTASASVMVGTGIASITGTTATVANTNITIDNNEFANCLYNSIIQATSTSGNLANNNFTITNNSFYFTVIPTTNSTLKMGIYIKNGANHVIANNWIGGSAAQTGGSALSFTGSAASSSFYPIYLAGTATSLVNIYGNTIANIIFPSTSTSSGTGFGGIYLSSSSLGNVYNNTIRDITGTSSCPVQGIYTAAANTKITGNIIGGSNAGDNLITSGTLAVGIYATNSKDTISDNIIKNISSTGVTLSTSTAADAVGIYSTGTSPYIYNNTIDSIVGNNTSNNGNAAVLGIQLSSGATGGALCTVAKNKITNIINTNTTGAAAYASSVSGISILQPASNASPVKIDGNYISGIYGMNTTAGNNITGILENNNATGGNDTFINNVIIINGASSANAWLKAIHISTGAQTHTFINNTFYISENVALNAALTSNKGGASIISRLNGNPNLNMYNNIFINKATNAGTGPMSTLRLMSNSTGITNADYNLYYTVNGSSLMDSVGTPMSLTSWKTSFAVDKYSMTGLAPFVSNADVHILTNNAAAWNAYGNGMAFSTIATDIEGNSRSTTMGVPTTLGAYEITMPTVTPAAMTISAAPTIGLPTVFTSNGKKIAEINWNAGATLPSSISATFYPGVHAPGSPNVSNVNSYLDIQQTGFAGTYTIKLYTNQAEANGIAFANMGAIKKHDGDASYTAIAAAGSNNTDADGNYILSNTLSNFSVFGLTDPTTPLPVTWNKVGATLNRQQQAVVSWTVSEKAIASYQIQKSLNGESFETIANVNSKGNGNNTYNYTEPTSLNGKAWYRIVQISVNGTTDYSTIMMLQNSAIYGKVNIYPNPATQVLNVEVNQADVPYAIYDLQGKMIAKGSLQSGKNTIDVASFAKGFYTIKIGDSNQKIVLN